MTRIRSIELHLVAIPLFRPFRTSGGEATEKVCILARVETDDAVGWGECVSDVEPGFSEEWNEGAWLMIRDLLAPALFAAGDVARFPAPALGTETRVEHEDHAKSHGKQVGANMAGADEPYEHLPFFYSDLFDLGYEAVGELDSRLRTTADWSDVGRAGTVYYVDDAGRPRGILLWNVFGRVEAARDLIRAAVPIPLAELVG